MQDHITREEFLLEFFGNLGRELADPKQIFTNNPMDVFPFIEQCTKEKKPAFISVQPRIKHDVVFGIEKIFYDFDYGKKSDKLTDKQIEKHTEKMIVEIRIFLHQLEKNHIVPLIVKTRKGFHIHIYFDSIYEISHDEEFWEGVYGNIYQRFIICNKHKYKYVDTTSKSDIKRLCRIPTSIHEKNGEECIILDSKLRPTKFRSIQYYRMYGLKLSDLMSAVEITRIILEKRKQEKQEKQEKQKENWEIEHGFIGDLRICFLEAIKRGEMSHKQRLAFLLEGWYSGKKTEGELVDLFHSLNDFDETKTRYQVKWFLDHEIYKQSKPYTCKTLQELNYCIKEKCPIWLKRKEDDKT